MSYYTGKNLDLRVRAFGLETLRKHLVDVSLGSAAWVDGMKVKPRNADETEQLRITLYSLLHDIGLKQYVQIKMVFGEFELCKKKEPEKAQVHIPSATRQEAPGTTHQEDYTGIFDDNDPLLEEPVIEEIKS